MPKQLKPMPPLRSDEEAEEFVATADLSEYDFSAFKPMSFEFEPKSTGLHLRVPESLLAALKAKATAQGIPHTRYVRMLIERDLNQA